MKPTNDKTRMRPEEIVQLLNNKVVSNLEKRLQKRVENNEITKEKAFEMFNTALKICSLQRYSNPFEAKDQL